MPITKTRPRNGPSVRSQRRKHAVDIAIIEDRRIVDRMMTGHDDPAIDFFLTRIRDFFGSDGSLQSAFRRPFGDGPGSRQLSTAHDRKTVTKSKEFGKIRADHQHGLPGLSERGDQRVDLSFTADVNAARGLIQKEDLAALMQKTAY